MKKVIMTMAMVAMIVAASSCGNNNKKAEAEQECTECNCEECKGECKEGECKGECKEAKTIEEAATEVAVNAINNAAAQATEAITK